MRTSLFKLFPALALSLAAACGGGSDVKQSTEPRDMDPVEITEYEGAELSSYRDFRENSILGPQKVDIASYRLAVDGLVNKPLNLTFDQVKARPAFRKVTDLHCVEGWKVKILWEGFKLRDILDEAGLKPGAGYVVFHAVDGYYTYLSLNYVTVHDLLVAWNMNGVPLKPQLGYPLMLVAEDRLGYKWCRWINRIEVTDSTGAKGYWENLGYPKSGDPAEWFR